MAPGGSSASNSAPAAENNFAASQFGGQIRSDQQQLPAIPDFLEWELFTDYDNYLEQNAQHVISPPDSGPEYPHVRPQSPGVAGPARPSSPVPVGVAPDGLTPPLIPGPNLLAPPHQDDASDNSAVYNNSPARHPDGEAGIDDGSSAFALGELMQSLAPAATTPEVRPERPHECNVCPTGVWRFSSARDLRRHTNTFHMNENTPTYKCGCLRKGWATSRKDNHLRHVERCRVPQPLGYFWYACVCGLFYFDKQVHLSHVLNCGRTRTRRRRSARRHSTRRRSTRRRSTGRHSTRRGSGGRRSSGRRSSGRPRAP